MAIATRWIGIGSVALVTAGLGAMLVGTGDARRPPQARPDPVFELRRCEGGISSFATNSNDPADFDRCLVDHARDVLSLRHEGAREVVTASMYSDLAICASHSTCSLTRTQLEPSSLWRVWTFSGRDAWDVGSGAVACAMVEQGGVRITSRGPDQVSIESEPGSGVEACIRTLRGFALARLEHHLER